MLSSNYNHQFQCPRARLHHLISSTMLWSSLWNFDIITPYHQLISSIIVVIWYHHHLILLLSLTMIIMNILVVIWRHVLMPSFNWYYHHLTLLRWLFNILKPFFITIKLSFMFRFNIIVKYQKHWCHYHSLNSTSYL